jgi:hypothetical protein
MVKYGVLFEVRTEFLNIIYTSFDFKGLITELSEQLTTSHLGRVTEMLDRYYHYQKHDYEPVSSIPILIVFLNLLNTT